MQNKWRAFSRWVKRKLSSKLRIVSLHIRSMWETTVMHKQVSGRTVNFGPNSPVYPFLELNSRIPPPPFRKTSDLGWPKFTPEYPPPFWKISDLGWPKFTPEYPPPHFGKLQIWDDQSLLRNTPPILENFRFGMTKVYFGIPPPPREFQNTESYYMWRLYPTRITTSLLLFHVKGGRIVNMSSTKNYLV